MNMKKALRICELRTGDVMHSWRRIAEVICEEYSGEDQDLHGNQLYGIDLCREAMSVIHKKEFKDLDDHIRDEWDT